MRPQVENCKQLSALPGISSISTNQRTTSGEKREAANPLRSEAKSFSSRNNNCLRISYVQHRLCVVIVENLKDWPRKSPLFLDLILGASVQKDSHRHGSPICIACTRNSEDTRPLLPIGIRACGSSKSQNAVRSSRVAINSWFILTSCLVPTTPKYVAPADFGVAVVAALALACLADKVSQHSLILIS